MRAGISGTVVEKREHAWEFSGRSGISYQLYIRAEGQSEAQAAQLVKCTPGQFAEFAEGDQVDVPVDVFANSVERQGAIVGAKLTVSLPGDYIHTKSSKAPRPVAVGL